MALLYAAVAYDYAYVNCDGVVRSALLDLSLFFAPRPRTYLTERDRLDGPEGHGALTQD